MGECSYKRNIEDDLDVMLTGRFAIRVASDAGLKREFRDYLKKIYACPVHGSEGINFYTDPLTDHRHCYCSTKQEVVDNG